MPKSSKKKLKKDNHSLNSIDRAAANKQREVKVQSEFHHVHHGPLPSPTVLQQYDHIIQGAAERIFAMAEEQAKHRQSLESKVVNAGARDSLLGLIFGLTIGLSTICGAVLCVLKGYQSGGTTLGVGGLASLVGVFVYGSKQRREEREAKMQSPKQ